MWRTERPGLSAEKAYQTCISGVDEQELKSRLARIQLTVAREAAMFAAAAAEGQFHTLVRTKLIDGLVTTQEMSKLYSTCFAKEGSAGRVLYDELISAARNGRCPLCGHGFVSTLDHFLPKSHYPGLSVTPLNLVPACRDCNIIKGRRFPRTPQDATLHPYFDNVEEDPWLGARVLEEKPVVMRFLVKAVPRWDEVTQARVEKHFKVLRLSRLYTANATEELSNIRENLRRIFRTGGAGAVQEYLREEARSRVKARINSWQSAMYTALTENGWYCGGGFE